MKGKLNLYYDEEGDFLEINIGQYREGYFENLGKGLFKRIDSKTKQATGFAVHGFKKRTKSLKNVSLSLPINIDITQ